MRHAHSGKIPFDCPFFSTAGHTLTGQSVLVGCSKCLVLLTACPLARRKKGRMGFCYVRYCRGAGSLLASPTLGLLEGLISATRILDIKANHAQPRGSGARRPLMRERG